MWQPQLSPSYRLGSSLRVLALGLSLKLGLLPLLALLLLLNLGCPLDPYPALARLGHVSASSPSPSPSLSSHSPAASSASCSSFCFLSASPSSLSGASPHVHAARACPCHACMRSLTALRPPLSLPSFYICKVVPLPYGCRMSARGLKMVVGAVCSIFVRILLKSRFPTARRQLINFAVPNRPFRRARNN